MMFLIHLFMNTCNVFVDATVSLLVSDPYRNIDFTFVLKDRDVGVCSRCSRLV